MRYARSRSRGSAAHPLSKAPTVDRTHVRTVPGMAGVAWLVLPYVWSQGLGRDLETHWCGGGEGRSKVPNSGWRGIAPTHHLPQHPLAAVGGLVLRKAYHLLHPGPQAITISGIAQYEVLPH